MIRPSSFFDAAINFGTDGPEGVMEGPVGFGAWAADDALANAAIAPAVSATTVDQRLSPFFGECGTTSRSSSNSVIKMDSTLYTKFAIAIASLICESPLVRCPYDV